MELNIRHRLWLNESEAVKDGVSLFKGLTAPFSAEDLYRFGNFNYPKFFKMDLLCKWAWLGAELLLRENGKPAYEGLDKNNIALVLSTHHGCLEADKKYQQSLETIPSPALFVYTLSNIMLGEICIRHGFKGEQACLISEHFDEKEIHFYVNDLLENRAMDACLFGWVDVTGQSQEVNLYWVEKNQAAK